MANLCEECGFDWDSSVLEQIRIVGLFPERASGILMGANERAHTRPSTETWSPNEYVWHMADMFSVFAEWLHMTRTQDHPTHATLDADRLCEVRGYAERPLETGLWTLRSRCALLIEEAAIADPARLVLYKGWRDVTAAEVIGFAAHEAAHHLFDLQRGLATSSREDTAHAAAHH